MNHLSENGGFKKMCTFNFLSDKQWFQFILSYFMRVNIFFKITVLIIFFVVGLSANLHAKEGLFHDSRLDEWSTEPAIPDYSESILLSKNSLAINFALGTGVRNGAASSYFTNPFFYGVNFEIHRNNLIVKSDILIGFGKVKQTMVFSDHSEWEKGQRGRSLIFNANVGYSLINSEAITIAPIGGLGWHALTTSTVFTSSSNPNEPFIFTYNVGFFIDFKTLFQGDANLRINRRDIYYSGLRFSVNYVESIVPPPYSAFFDGGMLYCTIGFVILNTLPSRLERLKATY